MDYALLILLALAIPVAWTAAFFMALGARKRLLALETRFAALDRWLLAGGTPPQQPAGAPHPAAPSDRPVPSGDPVAETIARQWGPQAAPLPPGTLSTTPFPGPTGPGVLPDPQPAPDANAAHDSASVQTGDAGSPPPSEPVPPGTATPPPTPPAVQPGLEERLGTRWVVWVGGVALALGAIFLVRYSIEQGLIGPGMRIFFGALLAAALIVAGEYLRRKELLSGVPGLPQASIPAILTAAGTVAAYATVWAAHGLYEFIGPAVAFPLLGLVALATLAAALLHGPWLAALGLVGAYVTPLLVSSSEPNFWALYLYLAVVTAAAFVLARMRLWRWLAITAVAASALWILPGLGHAALQNGVPHAAYLIAVFVLASALIVSGLAFGPDAETDKIDGVSSAALAAYLFAAMLVVIASGHATVPLVTFTALVIATVAIAWRAPAATAALPIAALLAAFVIAEWAVHLNWDTLLAPGGPVARDAPAPSPAEVGGHLLLGAIFTVLFGGAGFLAQGRAERPVISLTWAAAAVIAPVAILITLYYRVAGFERSIPFAGLALLLAALYATATELLDKRPPRPGVASAAALFAVGAVATLALCLTFALEKGWLTIALALMAPGIAMIADKRPLPLLRWLAAACAVLVCARILWEPRIVSDVGTTPIFNWLLWGYGVPAIAFWTAGYLLRRRADDVPARMLDSAAILFTVLTIMLQIRHIITGGDIYAPVSGLAEVGMQVSALLAMAIGLERVRGRSQSPVHNVAAVLVAGLALVIAAPLLLIRFNPLFHTEFIDAPFINLLLLSYGLPAVLAITLALVAKNTRPMAYRAIAAAGAIVLALTYLTLQVRRFYQGPSIGLLRSTSDAEFWAYSAVWLAFGVVLLLVGIFIRSQPARLASALVIMLTVFKVFLLDLAGIGGIWRSLSFIGLGVVLMGIGWLYQKLLFPPRPPATAAAPETPTPPESEANEAKSATA
jgi:uncharacterized membrane protein